MIKNNVKKVKINEIQYETQNGQALLFVVIAMTIALAIGINASVRTISSLSRTTRSNSADRALAAAEGGIDRFLALSVLQLESAVTGTCPSGITRDDVANACVISFTGSSDPITSQAYVTVSRYTPDYYPFEIKSGQVKEVNFYDFTSNNYFPRDEVIICWSEGTGAAPGTATYLTYFSYGIQGGNVTVLSQGGLKGASAPALPGFQESGFSSANEPVGARPYARCARVNIGNNAYGLRIRSVAGPSKVGIYSPNVADRLPLQGYSIISVGKLLQNTAVTATRTIKIVKTLPYLPAGFDYALYVKGDITTE